MAFPPLSEDQWRPYSSRNGFFDPTFEMDPSLRLSQEDNAIQSIVLEAPWFHSKSEIIWVNGGLVCEFPIMQTNDPIDLFLLRVALSYSVQIMDEGTVPLTPDDALVDALASPSGVIPSAQPYWTK